MRHPLSSRVVRHVEANRAYQRRHPAVREREASASQPCLRGAARRSGARSQPTPRWQAAGRTRASGQRGPRRAPPHRQRVRTRRAAAGHPARGRVAGGRARPTRSAWRGRRPARQTRTRARCLRHEYTEVRAGIRYRVFGAPREYKANVTNTARNTADNVCTRVLVEIQDYVFSF